MSSQYVYVLSAASSTNIVKGYINHALAHSERRLFEHALAYFGETELSWAEENDHGRRWRATLTRQGARGPWYIYLVIEELRFVE